MKIKNIVILFLLGLSFLSLYLLIDTNSKYIEGLNENFELVEKIHNNYYFSRISKLDSMALDLYSVATINVLSNALRNLTDQERILFNQRNFSGNLEGIINYVRFHELYKDYLDKIFEYNYENEEYYILNNDLDILKPLNTNIIDREVFDVFLLQLKNQPNEEKHHIYISPFNKKNGIIYFYTATIIYRKTAAVVSDDAIGYLIFQNVLNPFKSLYNKHDINLYTHSYLINELSLEFQNLPNIDEIKRIKINDKNNIIKRFDIDNSSFYITRLYTNIIPLFLYLINIIISLLLIIILILNLKIKIKI